MANETEIERLIVRLVGDDSSYRAMMSNAATATGELSSVSGEVEHAQEQVQDSLNDTSNIMDQTSSRTMGASRSVRFLGMEVANAGMAISTVNGNIGGFVVGLGTLTSSAGEAMHGIHAFSRVSGAIGGVFAGMVPYLPVILPAIAAAATATYLWRDRTQAQEKAQKELNDEIVRFIDLQKKLSSQTVSIGVMSFPGLKKSGSEGATEGLNDLIKQQESLIKEYDSKVALEKRLSDIRSNASEKYGNKAIKEGNTGYGKEDILGVKEWFYKESGQYDKLNALIGSRNARLRAEEELLKAKTSGEEAQKVSKEADSLSDQLRSINKNINDITTSVNKETSEMLASVTAGETYAKKQNAIADALLKLNDAAKKSTSNLEEANKALYSSKQPHIPGHELEESFAAGRDPKLESKSKELKDANDKIQSIYADASKNRLTELFENNEKRLRIQEQFTAKETAMARSRSGLLGAEAARQEAIDRARLENAKNKAEAEKGLAVRKPEIDSEAAGKRAFDDSVTSQIRSYNEEIRKSEIAQKYFAAELKAAATPRNEEIKSAIEAARAYDLLLLKYGDLTNEQKAKLQSDIKANAAQALNLKYLQDGAAMQEKYMEPLDRMIADQERLRKINDLGGFGKGEKGAKAYQKAMADAYAQAHKDYSAQFLGQQFDAIVGGTNAATRALYEYKVGMTAIPIDRMHAPKPPESKLTQAEEEELRGMKAFDIKHPPIPDKIISQQEIDRYIELRNKRDGKESTLPERKQENAGLPFNSEMATGIKDMVQGIRELVDLGKDKTDSVEISYANL